uniref:D-glycero-beta-D-manno-heptose-7-phosphate kinase n=1 Tax=candidate division WOR-3 bacterium TaxID=2052148 RepID=A0A7C4UBT1_UNCW3
MFKRKNILVAGDIMLDEYKFGISERISPEAPVPIVSIIKTERRLGGSGNVSMNVLALGLTPIPLCIVGEDKEGEEIISKFKEKDIITDGIIKIKDRRTTKKTRIIAQNQQVLRIDEEETDDIERKIEDKIVDFVERNLKRIDGIILQDYNKGFFTKNIIDFFCSLNDKVIVTVDPKFKNFLEYKNVSLFKPNERELEQVLGKKFHNDDEVIEEGLNLHRRINSPVLITRGKKGMILFEKNRYWGFESTAKDVFDVTGAGDTVIAVVTSAIVSGMDLKRAAMIASIAAGIKIGKLGAVPVFKEEIEEYLNEHKIYRRGKKKK